MASRLEEKVMAIVATVFKMPPEQVSMQTSQENVQAWDSLNLVNLMIAVESEFDVELGIEQASKLTSVEAIIQALGDKGVK